MNNLILVLFVSGLLFGLVSADTNGTFIGNQTTTTTDISAEFDVVATLSATEYWAEVWLNTSEINFGQVKTNLDWDTYKMKYKIRARGNVDINVTPILNNQEDNLFSNLYFNRTFESSKSKWAKIGEYSMRFNLTENEGLWTTLESSGFQNATSSNGIQSILLDLSDYSEPIIFDEVRKNKVKFVITPIWSSVETI